MVCLFLGLLAIPIYFLDEAALRPSGGNWISLDFRGLIFWTYITLLAIHVTLSSIGVLLFPQSGALRIQLGSMVLSVILLVTGFVIYGKLVRLQLMHAYEIRVRTHKRSGYPNLLCPWAHPFRYCLTDVQTAIANRNRNPNVDQQLRNSFSRVA